MRLLILFFFSTIVTLSIKGQTAPRTDISPDKIDTTPTSILLDETEDLEFKKSNSFLSYNLGQISGYLLNPENKTDSIFAEVRFNYKKNYDQTFSIGVLAALSQILIIEMSQQYRISTYDEISPYYRIGIAPIFNPSEGISTFADLKKVQVRFSLGSENLFLKQKYPIPLSIGLEMGLGYSLNGLSGSLALRFFF